VNKRLKIKDTTHVPFYAGHDGTRVVLKVRDYRVNVPEDRVEAAIRDLGEVLKRHGVK
jgi:hypothetical protein